MSTNLRDKVKVGFAIIMTLICLYIDAGDYLSPIDLSFGIGRIVAYVGIGIGLLILISSTFFVATSKNNVIQSFETHSLLLASLITSLIAIPYLLLSLFALLLISAAIFEDLTSGTIDLDRLVGFGLVVLGSTPLFVAWTFCTQSAHALRMYKLDDSNRRLNGRMMLMSIAICLLLPTSLQFAADTYVSRAIGTIVTMQADSAEADEAIEKLQKAFWCTDECYQPIREAYWAGGTQVKVSTETAYERLTGKMINPSLSD